MRLFSSLRHLTLDLVHARTRRHSPRRKPAAARSHLERLEDRWCPSAYNIKDLGTLGGTGSAAYAINSAGDVVGGTSTASGSSPAFLYSYSSGTMTSLGTLAGDTAAVATALNNSGQVVGNSEGSGIHAFLWQSSTGMMQPLGNLGGSETFALAVNNPTPAHPLFVVVGYGGTTAGGNHAWLWQNNGLGMTDLNNLIPANSGWVLTDADGINDKQQIVGTGTINGQGHAFLWQIGGGAPTDLGLLKGGFSSGASAISNNATVQVAGTCITTSGHETTWDPFLWTSPVGPMTNLGTLKGATETHALALNDLSPVQVVGSSNAAGPGPALLWENGKVIDLNTQIPSNSGWAILVTARGINDKGWIVGWGELVSGPPGTDHAFLLTPTATTPASVPTSASPTTATSFSLSAAPSPATLSIAVVIGSPATSPLTQGPAQAPALFLDAAHSSDPPSSIPTIRQALSSPSQAQSAPHIVFAQAEDDDGVFGDLDLRFVSSSRVLSSRRSYGLGG
jgi:probable HAF family extracellular repeat protein